MVKELDVVFPNKSKNIIYIENRSLSYDVKKVFLEEVLRQMKHNNISDISGLKISTENMKVAFSSAGIDDFWGQSHTKSVSAVLGEPERTILSITQMKRCFICKTKNCKVCPDIKMQTILNTIKTLQR